MLILHRENEIPRCRFDWWHDLWEPGPNNDWLLGISMRGPLDPDEGSGGSSIPLLQCLLAGSAPLPAREATGGAEPVARAEEARDLGPAGGDETSLLTNAPCTDAAAGETHLVDEVVGDLPTGDGTASTRPGPARQAMVQVCGTCRDFVPDAEGTGGWCRNLWAFSRRQRVQAEILACQGLLGCWWLPHDELWLAASDLSRHDEPTPLVDLLVRRLEP